MDTWTIAVSGLTGIGSILASVIAGVLAGRFGVRTALKQFTMQRGFDRRLDWHENTTQAVTEFLHLNGKIVFALKNDRPDLLKEATETTMPALKKFQETVNNSLLYADRKMYLRLKEVSAKLREITEATTGFLRAGADATHLYESNVKLLEQTIFELSQPIRGMLGLDELSLADFDK